MQVGASALGKWKAVEGREKRIHNVVPVEALADPLGSPGAGLALQS